MDGALRNKTAASAVAEIEDNRKRSAFMGSVFAFDARERRAAVSSPGPELRSKVPKPSAS
jgi:hypothetical protein